MSNIKQIKLENEVYDIYANQALKAGTMMPISSAGTGAAYTLYIEGITSLQRGLTIIFNPHTTSTTTNPTLNLNNLGAKEIRRYLSSGTNKTARGMTSTWIQAYYPLILTYNGSYWMVMNMTKPDVSDIPSGTEGQFLQTVSGTPTWVTVPYAEETYF